MVVCLVVTSLIILFLRDNIINYNFPNDENSITINKTDGSACIMQQNFRHIPETHDSFPQPLIIFRDKRLNTPATARVTIERVVCRKR